MDPNISIRVDNINLPENALIKVLQLMIIPRKLCLIVPVLTIGTTRLAKVINFYSVTHIQPFGS